VSSQVGLFRKYALDSSFLIDLWTREGSHPRDIHVGLWEHFDGQCERGEVIAPFEVREELENAYDQALDRWLRARKQMFIEISRDQLEGSRTKLEPARSRPARRTLRTAHQRTAASRLTLLRSAALAGSARRF
jgi:Domain of unknown function (DUF4411)